MPTKYRDGSPTYTDDGPPPLNVPMHEEPHKEETGDDPEKIGEFLESIQKKTQAWIDKETKNRKRYREALEFHEGINQWDPANAALRQSDGRPMMTINKMNKFTRQVTGDMRLNKFQVKITPANVDGDHTIAKIRGGLVSGIHYNSRAESIFHDANTTIVEGGYGAWRQLYGPSEDNPFLQDIYLELIENPMAVIMDANAAAGKCYRDANHAGIAERLSIKEFERKYPNASKPSDSMKMSQGISRDHWYNRDNVTVQEWFERVIVPKTMCLMDDGQVLSKEEANKKIKEWQDRQEAKGIVAKLQAEAGPQAAPPGSGAQQQQQPPAAPPQAASSPQSGQPGAGQPPQLQPAPPAPRQPMPSVNAPPPEPEPRILKEKEVDTYEIRHWVVSATEILAPEEDKLAGEKVPGRYIPITLVRGRHRNIEGEDYVSSLTRDSFDAQRNYNYAITSNAEATALQGKAPYIGTATQFGTGQQLTRFAQANAKNTPILTYTPHVIETSAGAQLVPPPHREPPPQPSPAYIQMMERADRDIHDTIGMGRRDVGETGPEQSGKAIHEASIPGDITVVDYHDYLLEGVMHSCMVINEMIPDIYDTKRDAQLRDNDNSEYFVPVNTTIDDAIEAIGAHPERYKGMDLEALKVMKAKNPSAKYNDIQRGRYKVEVTTGPAFSTLRQEAGKLFGTYVQGDPQAKHLMGDLILETTGAGLPLVDEAARRVRKTLPPGLIKPKPGEEKEPPMPPSPQMVAKMKEIEVKAAKVANEKAKIDAHAQEMQLNAQIKVKEMEIKLAELALKKLELANELAKSKGAIREEVVDILREVGEKMQEGAVQG
jgi:hypothetical protein